MKNNPSKNRPTKDEILRTRCSTAFKDRVARMCSALDKDISDIMREAVAEKVLKFEQGMASIAA